MKSIDKIAVLGGGSWGSAIAKSIAEKRLLINSKDKSKVTMWLYEEEHEGRQLTEIINTENENKKYLPSVKLPKNLEASSDIKKCTSEADVIVFVIPEKFITSTVAQFCDIIQARKSKPLVISLSKGLLEHDGNGLELISQYLSRKLDTHVSVLMGANIAMDVALGHLAEATISGCKPGEDLIYRQIFETKSFLISFSASAYSVELFGALKNIVSLAVGIVNGLEFPCNTCVAVMRQGLIEMVRFVRLFAEENLTALLESCGVADLVASCEKGRNFKCGVCIAKNKTVEDVESDMCGQKIQGVRACELVHQFVYKKKLEIYFPFFETTFRILSGQIPCHEILTVIGASSASELYKSFN